MQRSILASAILLSITACDSDSVNLASDSDAGTITIADTTFETPANEDTTTVAPSTPETEDTVADQPSNDGTSGEDGDSDADEDKNDDNEATVVVVSNDDGKGDEVIIADETDTGTADNAADDSQAESDADNATSDEGQISDDAGSATSDGGQTADNSGDNSDDDASDNTSDESQISDDAGSATSDGGQTADNSSDNTDDDASDNTSDEGQISDDAGSATSDGGQAADDTGEISDDAGSATSDGGLISDDDISDDAGSGSTDTDTSTPAAGDTDAGSFESPAVEGDVLRVSSLVSNTSENICTTLSDQNNFSDTPVGDFILHNNAWRPLRAFPGYEWEQCITTNTNGAVVGWNYDWGPGQPGANGRASDDFFVRSYPELIFGTKDEFRTSAPQSVTGLPVMVSEMPTFRIDYAYDGPQFGEPRVVDASNNARFPNGTTISGERNVAVEAFFYATDASGNCSSDTVTRAGGSNHEYEVMVWLDAGAERLPAGPANFVADLNIRGADYKVYTKNSDERYIAFVAQNPQTTGTIFWNDFTDWARENAHVVRERFGALSNSVQIQDDWCMANILVGTEIFWGAGSVGITEWTITQSR